jgi:hypothetical protein
MESKKTYKILTILLIMQWAFIQLIAQFPAVIETYYSNGLYLYISNFLRIIFGWIPFSVGDVLYIFGIIFILKAIYKTFKTKQFNLKNTLFKIGGILSVIYFLFNLNWGLNYFRTPLSETFHFEKESYSNADLFDLTQKFIQKVNAVQVSITKNDTIIVENPVTKNELRPTAYLAYEKLQKKYSQFNYTNPKVKNSLFSLPLTYMGFSGYLSPLTNEAQVNSLIPTNNYPATTCHEIAHQVGYASEKEANFVGYLAAINSEDIYFNYSGYLMALRYCLAEVYRKKPEKFEILKVELNKGVLKDLKQQKDFWESYQNWSEQYFKIFYDSFLKANKQDDGIEGYNQVVLLLINYYSTEEL